MLEFLESLSHGYINNHDSIKQTITYSSVITNYCSLTVIASTNLWSCLTDTFNFYLFQMDTSWMVRPKPSVILARGRVILQYARDNFATDCRHFPIISTWSGSIKKGFKILVSKLLVQETHCPFPGYLTHGKVLLVGHMGLYDYRKMSWHQEYSWKYSKSSKNISIPINMMSLPLWLGPMSSE